MAETARSLIRFRLTSSVIRKITHKIAFWATLWGHHGQYKLYIKVLMQKNFVAKFHRQNASFTRKTAS